MMAFASLCAEFRRKRDRLCGTLTRVGRRPHVPRGAYYVLADTSLLPGATSEKEMYLLHATGVGHCN